MDRNDIECRLSTALTTFFEEERKLLESDVRENALSHKLAVHLAKHFNGWDIDTEYDKMHAEGVPVKKKYIGTDGKEHDAIPDIIVHTRQTMNNLLALEIKKIANTRAREHDFTKLSAYRNQLGYLFAAFVEVGICKGDPVFKIRFV